MQKGVGPLVSSQERRAIVVLLIRKPVVNRSSSDYRVPWFGFHRIQYVRAFEAAFKKVIFRSGGRN